MRLKDSSLIFQGYLEIVSVGFGLLVESDLLLYLSFIYLFIFGRTLQISLLVSFRTRLNLILRETKTLSLSKSFYSLIFVSIPPPQNFVLSSLDLSLFNLFLFVLFFPVLSLFNLFLFYFWSYILIVSSFYQTRFRMVVLRLLLLGISIFLLWWNFLFCFISTFFGIYFSVATFEYVLSIISSLYIIS